MGQHDELVVEETLTEDILEDPDNLLNKLRSIKICEKASSESNVPIPNVQKPTYLDCPSNWAQYLACGVNIFNPTTKKYILEWLTCHEKQLEYVLQCIPIEYFLKKVLQAMYMANSPEDNPKGACVMLDQLMKSVMQLTGSQFSEEYKEGVINLIICSKHEIKMSFGVTSHTKINANPKMLETLSDSAKCPVLAAKLIFCKIAKGQLIYQQQLGKQILSYESNRAEWYHLYHSILRNMRHQDTIRYRFRPEAFELQALSKALLIDPENEEILISVLKTLFDCVKQRKSFYVQIGTLEFSTREEIVDYICDTIIAATKDGKNSTVRGLLAASQIIGYFRMPEGKRDVELAEALLYKAIEVWPTNSKILFRLGLLHLMEKKDPEKAKEVFLQAISFDPSNAMSTMYYYWMDSANVKVENVEEIEKKMNSKAACQWESHVRLDLHFLKGCIYLSTAEKTEKALIEWDIAQKIDFQYFMTKIYSLNNTLRKFSWKRMDDEGKKVPMYASFVEKCVRTYVESLSLLEAEDTGFRQLAGILKTVKAARTKPIEDGEKMVNAENDRDWRKKT